MTFYTLRYHDFVCKTALSEQQAEAVLEFLFEADGFCPSKIEAPQAEKDRVVAWAFVLDDFDGSQTVYPQALPGRVAIGAAAKLVRRYKSATVHRCEFPLSAVSKRSRPING